MQEKHIYSIEDWYTFRKAGVGTISEPQWGTQANPIKVYLEADLDFANEAPQSPFWGTYVTEFEGNNHTIKNIYIISNAGSYFFGWDTLKIFNLHLEKINIISAQSYACPFIAGYAENIHVTGYIYGANRCAGVFFTNNATESPQCIRSSFSGALNAPTAIGIISKQEESAYCEPTTKYCFVQAILTSRVNNYCLSQGFRGYYGAESNVQSSFSILTLQGDNIKGINMGSTNIWSGTDRYLYCYVTNIEDVEQVNIVSPAGNQKNITQNYVICNDASKINFTNAAVPILPFDENLIPYLRDQGWSI